MMGPATRALAACGALLRLQRGLQPANCCPDGCSPALDSSNPGHFGTFCRNCTTWDVKTAAAWIRQGAEPGLAYLSACSHAAATVKDSQTSCNDDSMIQNQG